jgi:hypothetical protein
MQSWIWRTIILGAVIIVLIYTATRPDPEAALLYSSSPADLVGYLSSSRDSLRRHAAARLLAHGADAVPALVARMPDADETEIEQLFLVLEDLYVSADSQVADATEAALEQLAGDRREEVRQATKELFQANNSRRYLRACAAVEAMGGKLLSTPFRMRSIDLQFASDIAVIDDDWTGGDAGLKSLSRLKGLQWVHIADDAPVSPQAIAELASLPGVGIRREREACCLGVEVKTGGGALTIRQLVSGSPAERAGMEPGDRLVSIADAPISNFDNFLNELRSHRPGDTVSIVVQRREQLVTISVELGTDFGTGRCRCLDAPVSNEPETTTAESAPMSIPHFFSPNPSPSDPPSTDRVSQVPNGGLRPMAQPGGGPMSLQPR